MTEQAEVKSICIIGAGAAGLALLRVLSSTAAFASGHWRLTALEARDDVGGIW
jgi:cation diffusion facilitator CzcD-associated flavoprotein CzcO